MGVSLYATNSKYSFEMGSGGFFSLRKNIAEVLDTDFGDLYGRLLECHTKEDFEWFNKLANQIAQEKKLDDDILDFLFQPDMGGAVSYKTCQKIYNMIKDVDFGEKGFQYVTYRKDDYENFKLFLQECYQKRRKMRWC